MYQRIVGRYLTDEVRCVRVKRAVGPRFSRECVCLVVLALPLRQRSPRTPGRVRVRQEGHFCRRVAARRHSRSKQETVVARRARVAARTVSRPVHDCVRAHTLSRHRDILRRKRARALGRHCGA